VSGLSLGIHREGEGGLSSQRRRGFLGDGMEREILEIIVEGLVHGKIRRGIG
jgi:hypothetical protein